MNLENFLDKLSKEKYLVYFILAWAGEMFFWAISSLAYRVTALTSAYSGLILFTRLFDLGAGIVLALLAFKLLIPTFMASIKREPLVTYFLLLWAGSFFFGAIADIAYDAQYGIVDISDGIGILGTLASLAAGTVLALFAWKLLQSKPSLEVPPPPPQ
jgi:hypothetical protein